MASEQAHKIDGAVRKLRAVMEAFDMKGTNRATMLNAINTIEALRTRPAPAATDTGLVTVALLNEAKELAFTAISRMRAAHISCLDLTMQAEKLVGNIDADIHDRSQAEELLAAERAEKERLAALLHDNGTPRFNAVCERAEKAEADNAAQAARIKELSEALDKQRELDNESTLHHYNRAKALEAKLAAAEKALEPFADIADLIDAETEGMAETDELILLFHDYEFAKWPVSFFRKARAVLGGKPS